MKDLKYYQENYTREEFASMFQEGEELCDKCPEDFKLKEDESTCKRSRGYTGCRECVLKSIEGIRFKDDKPKCPRLYQHFKHTEEGITNNYQYATMFISQPITKGMIRECYNNNAIVNQVYCVNTESGETNFIFETIDGDHYHLSTFSNFELVIYKSLYDDNKAYARSLEMFMSKVPRGKENPSGQEYRFEEMK